MEFYILCTHDYQRVLQNKTYSLYNINIYMHAYTVIKRRPKTHSLGFSQTPLLNKEWNSFKQRSGSLNWTKLTTSVTNRKVKAMTALEDQQGVERHG